jgi:monoterpene epsilon-lactone hydrolase
MASPELDTVMQMIRARGEDARVTTEDNRLSYERLVASLPLDDDISTEKVGAGGVAAEWVVAPEAQDGRVLLYFHGGGYVFGSMRTHRIILAHLSRAAQARVLGLEYRLAPEFPFPAPVEDAVAAYRWLLSNGTNPKKIVLAGDSAGGGLTIAALVALRYLGEPMPAAGVGISPWTDMEATGESFVTNAEVDPMVTRDGIHNIATTYLSGKDPRSPLASPIYADLTGLPPLLLQVGSIETLLDDTTVLAQRAREAGVEVEVDVWDDMPHVWHHFAPILPEARQAIQRMAEFMRKHTG